MNSRNVTTEQQRKYRFTRLTYFTLLLSLRILPLIAFVLCNKYFAIGVLTFRSKFAFSILFVGCVQSNETKGKRTKISTY